MTQVIRRRGIVGQPSLRAQILLVVSAFLCGTVLAGLLFVGVWRQTADNGTRAQLAQRATERRLVAARHKLATVSAESRQTHALLSKARASLRAQIASNATMSGRLSGVTASARSLETQLSTLESELTTLEGYAKRPGPAGIDAAYLATQVRYLRSSAAAAAAAAAKLSH